MHDSSSKGLPTEPGPEPGPDLTRSRAPNPDRANPGQEPYQTSGQIMIIH
jgi:hypothetical protein